MGIAEKLSKAKKTDWVSEGFSKAEVKTIVELAKISAQIERCRLEMSMTQQEFAKFMGVTQGMVSKWESREYNFTNSCCVILISSLHRSICAEIFANSTIVFTSAFENPSETQSVFFAFESFSAIPIVDVYKRQT